MKINQELYSVVLVILILALNAISAEKLPKSVGKSAQSSKTQPKNLSKDQLAWEEALGQVKLLAAKFQEYRDTAVASRSLAGLASVVCQYDKMLAPVLFSQAMEMVQAGLRNPEIQNREQLWAARAVVISSASQCDPQLGEQLNQSASKEDEEKNDPNRFWSELRTARELLTTNESKSIQVAEAVSQQIPHLQEVQLSFFYGLLWRLRRQAPAAADQIFLQALDQLRQNPNSAIRALGVLANYVFAPAGGENTDMLAAMPFGNENDHRLYFFQTQRSGATEAAMQGYLQTAAQVLANVSPSAEKEAGVSYALAQQLVQRSQEIAPDLAPDYQGSVERLSPLFPEGELRSRVSNSMALQAGKYEQQLEEELDKATDPRQRDKIRLSLFAIRWAGREVLKAEKLAVAVEEDRLKTQLLALVAFRNTEMALAKKDLVLAQLHSRSLKSSLHRALAFLSIAQQSEQQKDRESATEFLNSAIREAENIDREQRPYLLTSAATVSAPLYIQLGMRNLEDAVAGLNLLDATSTVGAEKTNASSTPSKQPPKSIFASDHGIVEFAQAGDLRRHFDLRLPGLTFDLPSAVKALRSSPPEHLSAVLLTLQNEVRQGPALAAAAASYLQRAKPNKVGSSTN